MVSSDNTTARDVIVGVQTLVDVITNVVQTYRNLLRRYGRLVGRKLLATWPWNKQVSDFLIISKVLPVKAIKQQLGRRVRAYFYSEIDSYRYIV